MRILYLTDLPCWHVDNDLLQFLDTGNEIILINTHPKSNGNTTLTQKLNYEKINLYKGINRLLTQHGFPYNKIGLSKHKIVRRKLQKIIDHSKIDLVYAAWSSTIVPEILTIKHDHPWLPVIWRILMYPAATNSLLLSLENKYCAKAINKIDGFIFSTSEIRDYLYKINPNVKTNYIIVPEYLSKQFFHKERLQLLSEKDGEPHIVFLGTLSDLERNHHNDVRQLILNLASSRIHIHLVQNDYLFPSDYIHHFPKLSFGDQIGSFITQFDACLVSYNLNNYKKMERFHNVVPNRLITATLGGVPVALQSNVSKSSERFITELGIGFVFENPLDLKCKLLNSQLMQQIRLNYINMANKIQYENYKREILSFLGHVISLTN